MEKGGISLQLEEKNSSREVKYAWVESFFNWISARDSWEVSIEKSAHKNTKGEKLLKYT